MVKMVLILYLLFIFSDESYEIYVLFCFIILYYFTMKLLPVVDLLRI